jgi:hypothetical protein
MWNHEINPFTAVYVNDRNTTWSYDDAGNLKNDGAGRVTTYDVANRVTKWETLFDSISQKYDGDGQAVRRVETRSDPFFTSTIYYLRSTVMGGLAVAEINSSAKLEVGYIYANSMEIARYRKPSSSQAFEVQWSHAEPMTGDRIEAGVSITTDPLGGLVPGSDPFVVPNVDYGDLLGERTSHTSDSDPFSLGSGCTLDGVPIDCNLAVGLANQGAASVAPLKSVTAVIYQGQTVLAFWQSYADGYEGFVPVNAIYTGGGGFRPAGPPRYSDLRVSRKGDTDFRALNGVSDGDDPEALLAQSQNSSDLPTGLINRADILQIIAPGWVVQLPDLRKGLDELLKRADCANFVKNLINQVAKNTGKPFLSDDVLTLFDKINAQGGYVLQAAITGGRRVGGTVGGYISNNDAKVFISPFAMASSYIRPEQNSYIMTALHETIHHAAGNRYYHDHELAQAAFDLGAAPKYILDIFEKIKKNDVSANSSFWNGILNRHCNPQ